MKIGIDARVLEKGMTGVGRYLLNIMQELPKHDKENEYYAFGCTDYKIEDEFFNVIYNKDPKINSKLFSPIWLNIYLPQLIKAYKIDILFSPNVLTPLVHMKGVKVISVVHDVMAKLYKDYYPFLYRQYLDIALPMSLKKANKIITVSESSKKDIMRIYSVPGEKIHVAYNIAPVEFKPRNNPEYSEDPGFKRLQLPNKYLLYVGMIEKRKNIIMLIKLADRLHERGSNIKLVLVGKSGYGFEAIHSELQKRNVYIKYLQGVEDGMLKYIYNSAFAFVFPSYYEGFGSPPLEAMQSGIPVLASNTSSIPEVVGDGGMLFEPDDVEGYLNAVVKLDTDKEFYSVLKYKATERAKKFTAESLVNSIMEVFNEVK